GQVAGQVDVAQLAAEGRQQGAQLREELLQGRVEKGELPQVLDVQRQPGAALGPPGQALGRHAVVLHRQAQVGGQAQERLAVGVQHRLVDDQARRSDGAVKLDDLGGGGGALLQAVGEVQGVGEGVIGGEVGGLAPAGQDAGVQPQLGAAEAGPV